MRNLELNVKIQRQKISLPGSSDRQHSRLYYSKNKVLHQHETQNKAEFLTLPTKSEFWNEFCELTRSKTVGLSGLAWEH